MEILYKNKTIEKVCTKQSEAIKKYGKRMAEKIDQHRLVFEKKGEDVQIAFVIEIVDYH